MKRRSLPQLVRDARRDFDESRDSFHGHIRIAHDAGLSIRKIAEAAGLSPTRVHQILKGD